MSSFYFLCPFIFIVRKWPIVSHIACCIRNIISDKTHILSAAQGKWFCRCDPNKKYHFAETWICVHMDVQLPFSDCRQIENNRHIESRTRTIYLLARRYCQFHFVMEFFRVRRSKIITKENEHKWNRIELIFTFFLLRMQFNRILRRSRFSHRPKEVNFLVHFMDVKSKLKFCWIWNEVRVDFFVRMFKHDTVVRQRFQAIIIIVTMHIVSHRLDNRCRMERRTYAHIHSTRSL